MAATREQLINNTAITATGNTSRVPIERLTMAVVGVDITAGSGTIADFDLWLECSLDGGTTWWKIPADFGQDAGTDFTAPRTNIVNSKSTTTAAKSLGVYKHLPASSIRLGYSYTGASSPSLTMSAWFEGK